MNELQLLKDLTDADSPVAAKALSRWIENGRLEVDLVMRATAQLGPEDRVEYKFGPNEAAAWLQRH